MPTLHIILSSVRPNRFGEHPARWLVPLAGETGFKAELVDLKEWQLPNYNEKGSPNTLKGQLENPQGMVWNAKVAEADAYVIVTPEYNRGYPASLKNALDWAYAPWNNKPLALVGYGAVGGARAVEQLRQVAVELQMAPVRNSLHIMRPWELVDEQNNLKQGALDPYAGPAKAMLEQLMWWARALKTARGA